MFPPPFRICFEGGVCVKFYLTVEGEDAGDLAKMLSAISQNSVPLPPLPPQPSQSDTPPKTAPTPIAVKGQRGFVTKYDIPDGHANPEYTRLRKMCRKHSLSYPELVEKGLIQSVKAVKNPAPEEIKSDNRAPTEPVKLPLKCQVAYKDPRNGRERTGKLSRQHPIQGTGIVLPDGTAGEALEINLSELRPVLVA